MLISKNASDHGIIIEFKVFRPKKEKNLEETCANALQQIADKHYITELKARGIPSANIFVYGFAFKGKEVLICGGRMKTDPH